MIGRAAKYGICSLGGGLVLLGYALAAGNGPLGLWDLVGFGIPAFAISGATGAIAWVIEARRGVNLGWPWTIALYCGCGVAVVAIFLALFIASGSFPKPAPACTL